MKKLLTIGTAMLFSLGGLVGCGIDANTTEPDDSTDGTEVESSQPTEKEETDITVWLDNDDYAKHLIEAMEVALPHINFNYENVGTVDAIDKIALDGPAGLGADVLLLAHDQMADGVNQSLLLPLGDQLSNMMEGRVIDAALGTVKNNDTYYGVPLSTESVALFYNKTLLDELGLEVATSFEELIEQAEGYTDTGENNFLLRYEAGNAYHSHFVLTAAGFELFGPNHDDANAINFNTPEVVEGLKFFQQIKEILPVPAGDLDGDSTEGAFVNGEVPYLITGPWSIPDIHEDGDFEWGVTTIPTIKGIQPTTFSGHTIAAMSAFTKNAEAAREVIDFMASDEGLQIMYDYRGSIPALLDGTVIDGLADDPYMLGVLAQAEFANPMPIIPEMQSYWQTVEGMYQAVWDGLLTPEEAAEKAESDFYAALALQQ